ncbi:MAG: M56 family metallopeptidase [Planctomycetes bacterium]|nr:M56 family metallopeptidase [Planctomycetota bacterium]
MNPGDLGGPGMTDLLEIALSNAAMATALAVLAAVVCRVYRRSAFAHGVWLVVLVKLVTPPLVTVPLPWFAEPADEVVVPAFLMLDRAAPAVNLLVDQARNPAVEPFDAVAAEDAATHGSLSSWKLPIVIVWLTGSVCVLAWMARSIVRFRRLLRFARPAEGVVEEITAELARRLKLARHPEVCLVPGTVSPMLWGLGARPRVLLPVELLPRLDREQLRTIILHELAHWQRRDHWVRPLEMVVTALYWWHPAVWWARAELREAEEQCCDAWVIATIEGAERAYALALLETVAFLSRTRVPLPVSASGIGQVSHLRRRLTMIMTGHKRRSLTWAGCAALLAIGLLALPLLPIRAQQADKKELRGVINLQVDGGAGSFEILLGGDGAPDKEAIELLKRALKLLAEKQQVKPLPNKQAKAQREEAENLVQAVGMLEAQAAEQRRKLAETQAKLARARERLAQLKGGPGGGAMPMHLELKLAPDGTAKKAIILGTPAKKIEIPRNLILKIVDGKITGIDARKAAPSPDELRARLDRLLREVEELRRAIPANPTPKQ